MLDLDDLPAGAEPHEIAALHEFVQKLPVVMAQLEPHEIKLLPRVSEKRGAPFSNPRGQSEVREPPREP
jgi:hypothetical protein